MTPATSFLHGLALRLAHLSRTCGDKRTAAELAALAAECLTVASEWEAGGPPTAPAAGS